MGLTDKLRELEEELRRTQKNKATEYHIGILKAKIANIKRQLASPKKSAKSDTGFAVRKSGDATVAIIGLPSVGKSSLLNALTNASSKTAPHYFTTTSCIPGTMEYAGSKIQLLDLPGILEGAHEGRGRGREVIGVARSADLILILLDIFKPNPEPIKNELEAMGIRLDKSPPKISIIKRTSGGLEISSTLRLTKLSPKTIIGILNEYKIHNAHITFREDADEDSLIDICVGNRCYIPSLIAINKVDLAPPDYLSSLQFDFIPISVEKNINIDLLKREIYKKLNLIRVYTRPRGSKADIQYPLMLPSGSTVADVCKRIQESRLEDLQFARIWGPSARFEGQMVGPSHTLQDGDILTLYFKKPQTSQ
ncbi:MAG: GTP-binding protein [Candidatus Anstonellales archaeon]